MGHLRRLFGGYYRGVHQGRDEAGESSSDIGSRGNRPGLAHPSSRRS